MKVIELKKNSVTKLDVKEGDTVKIYNMSVEHLIDVISGPNGLVNVALLPRSGIGLVVDSILSIRTGDEEMPVAYDVLSDEVTQPPVTDVATLAGKSFYLDAGHGGSDPGAVNDNLGLRESIAALDVCLYLGEALEKEGARIYYSRTTDIYPTLSARTSQANSLNVDAFISIHLNSAASKEASGIETLCYKANSGVSGELAKIVQDNLIAVTGWKDRGVKSRPDLHVLKATKMPAILCEIGFISNDEEAKQLFQEAVQVKIANAIARGVIKIFKG